jgi:hypothetical protein
MKTLITILALMEFPIILLAVLIEERKQTRRSGN